MGEAQGERQAQNPGTPMWIKVAAGASFMAVFMYGNAMLTSSMVFHRMPTITPSPVVAQSRRGGHGGAQVKRDSSGYNKGHDRAPSPHRARSEKERDPHKPVRQGQENVSALTRKYDALANKAPRKNRPPPPKRTFHVKAAKYIYEKL